MIRSDAPRPGEDLFQATVRHTLEAHGARALSLARTLGHGLQYIPSVRWMRFVTGLSRDLVEAFALLAERYAAVSDERLDALTHARLLARPVPLPGDFDELAVATFVQGQAWWWQLREHDRSAHDGLREVALRLARSVNERLVVVEPLAAARWRDGDRARMTLYRDRWAQLARASFGRAGTPGISYAISNGLRRRDVDAVVRDFDDDLSRVFAAHGEAPRE